ncbi:hypothetical protein H6P81_012371 [Aristolochia fimbriata]|uniref:NAC domain-containing protein n=1 Tax=Aristolochia fimbriata TaxID=158543 RepID=A0AAV7EBQ8_ARIFI|nr:hypothetical protein H6P81_012371 [Aristolochia fimbriata]
MSSSNKTGRATLLPNIESKFWIDSYLRPRIVEGTLEDVEWISEVKDICSFDPDELVVISKVQKKEEDEWWFISTSTKPPFQWQIAKTGNWEEHLESVKETMENGEIAWKIPVVFCKHGSPKSIETEWRMDQFHLPGLAPLIFLCRLWKSEDFTPEINGGMNGSQQDHSEGGLGNEANGGNGSELDQGAASSPSSTSSAVDNTSDTPKRKEVKEEAAAEEPVHTACLDSDS